MATRILMSDLPGFVKDTLLKIRQGVNDARVQGLVAELPEYVDFTVEIVSAAQTMTQVTTTVVDDASHETVDNSQQTERTVESVAANEVTTESHAADEVTNENYGSNEVTTESHAASEVTTESPATDTETVARDATQATNEGGSDLEVSSYTYNSFAD